MLGNVLSGLLCLIQTTNCFNLNTSIPNSSKKFWFEFIPISICFRKIGLVQRKLKRVVVYELNVIDFENIHLVRLNDGEKIPYKAGSYSSDKVTWLWTPWQLCDRCGVLSGEKRKFGKLIQLNKRKNIFCICYTASLFKVLFSSVKKKLFFTHLFYQGCET